VDLIRHGLFELMPALYVPYSQKRRGLYTAQVVYRKIGYPSEAMYSYDACRRSVPLTTDILKLVRKITLNFVNIPAGVKSSKIEPPLHIFLQFLTLHKRDKADPVLMTWIKKRYDGKFGTIYHTEPLVKSQKNEHS
jgi:hypothetical protein